MLNKYSGYRFQKIIIVGAALCLLTGADPLVADTCEAIQESAANSEDDASVISVHCGGAPSATLDENGRLWVTFVQDEHVYISQSHDRGQRFELPVMVNPSPEDAEFNGENRPKIIVDGDDVYLSWTRKTSANFTGEIRFSKSSDGGKTFTEPRTVNDDNLFTGHRFESLMLTESGHLYLVWLDKRDMEASLERGDDYAGAAAYYAVSSDRGETFSRNFRVANNSCECCRIAMAPHGDDQVAIFWRHIFDETTRDHAFAVLTPTGAVENQNRATYDDWQINACPHHGPAMAAAEEGSYHISWFSNGSNHSGIYYAQYEADSASIRHLRQVDGAAGAGHPQLAEFKGNVYLIWKGFDGLNTQLRLISSSDNGATWSEPMVVMSTGEASDHPLLVKHTSGLYLSWLTEEHGYVFEELSNANP
ncbi:MAG: sialidase family protein [Pseudohongiellaceae bacterium]